MEDVHVKTLVKLREASDSENKNCIRVGFMTRSGKTGYVPVEDLVVLVDKPAREGRSYFRYDREWPKKLNVIGKKWRRGRLLCRVPVGVMDGVVYFGTTEMRWKATKKAGRWGRKVMRPVPVGTEGAISIGSRHDLMEQDLRSRVAFNPGKYAKQVLTLNLAVKMYNKSVREQESWQVTGYDEIVLPNVKVTAAPPYKRFKLREEDPKVAVETADRIIDHLRRGYAVTDERGASVLLNVLRCANEGCWTGNEAVTECAHYTGAYRYHCGVIEGREVAFKESDMPTVKIGGRYYLEKSDTYKDPSEDVNKMIHRLFRVSSGFDTKFLPAIGEDWTHVRKGGSLWRPQGVDKADWTPEELVTNPHYEELCYLAALGTVQDEGTVAYADIDMVSGNSVVVDLDSAPNVQLVRTLEGLICSSSGIRCNLGRFDVEADFEEWRRKKKTQTLQKPNKG